MAEGEGERKDSPTCVICWSGAEKEELKISPCVQCTGPAVVYHYGCLAPWAREVGECPTCHVALPEVVSEPIGRFELACKMVRDFHRLCVEDATCFSILRASCFSVTCLWTWLSHGPAGMAILIGSMWGCCLAILAVLATRLRTIPFAPRISQLKMVVACAVVLTPTLMAGAKVGFLPFLQIASAAFLIAGPVPRAYPVVSALLAVFVALVFRISSFVFGSVYSAFAWDPWHFLATALFALLLSHTVNSALIPTLRELKRVYEMRKTKDFPETAMKPLDPT